MEDILASIKRIIAEEPAPSPRETAPSISQPTVNRAAPLAQPQGPSGVGTSMEPPPWPRRADPPAPESVLELTDPLPDAAPPWPPVERPAEPPLPPIQRTMERPAEPVLPPVQRAVERLRQAEAEMPQPSARPVPRDLLPRTPTPRATGRDVTIEALVREMLQPMLADWIDKNLPEIVERLVQAEIRRMSDRE